MTDLKSMENYLHEYALPGLLIAALRVNPDSLPEITGDAENALRSAGKGKGADQILVDAEWLSAALVSEVGRITEDCGRALTLITSLRDPDMRDAFKCRYFARMTFAEIAKKLCMSSTKVKNLHKRGLMILKKRWD